MKAKGFVKNEFASDADANQYVAMMDNDTYPLFFFNGDITGEKTNMERFKSQVVVAIKEFFPNFEHEEKGVNLEQKM